MAPLPLPPTEHETVCRVLEGTRESRSLTLGPRPCLLPARDSVALSVRWVPRAKEHGPSPTRGGQRGVLPTFLPTCLHGCDLHHRILVGVISRSQLHP